MYLRMHTNLHFSILQKHCVKKIAGVILSEKQSNVNIFVTDINSEEYINLSKFRIGGNYEKGSN